MTAKKSKTKPKTKPVAKKKAAPAPKAKAAKTKPKPAIETHANGVESIKGQIAHSLFITAQTTPDGTPTGAVQVILKSAEGCLGFIAGDEKIFAIMKEHLDEAIAMARSVILPSQTVSAP